MKGLIQFEPIAMERVWGGRKLEARFGKTLPPGSVIGELWEVVDREEAQSVVHEGYYRGLTLQDLWTKHREQVFGEVYRKHPSSRFPLLIKLLDARERLSVQVHPPAHLASALNGEPKTEMWYFLNTDPGAHIFAGLTNGVTREHFEKALHDGTVEQTLHHISVNAGQSIFIPSGRLHAIGEGCVIIEIQQNSDTTYRVFDWNRMGLDGHPRALHIDESLESIDFADFEPGVKSGTEALLAECPYFRVEKIVIEDRASVDLRGRFALLCVAGGTVEVLGKTLHAAQFALIPADEGVVEIVALDSRAEVLFATLPE